MRNMPKRKIDRRFTLIELMVAMAILVIMMGFLFQFVISAQRLWSASSQKAGLYEQAQIILSSFESDFHNVIAFDDSGPAIQHYRHGSGLNSVYYPIGSHLNIAGCFFLTQSEEYPSNDSNYGMGFCPVVYIFCRTHNGHPIYKLYRIPLYNDLDYIELSTEKLLSKITDLLDSDKSQYIFSHPEYIIAENVADCNIQFVNYANENRPKVAKITITLFDPQRIANFKTRIKDNFTPASKTDDNPDTLLTSADWEEKAFLPNSYQFTKLIALP